MRNQKIFDAIVTEQLAKATTELQNTKDFSYEGFLKLHSTTFQDDAQYPQAVSEQLQTYGRVRNFNEPRDHTWGKNRDIEGYGRSLTLYSNMSDEDLGRAKVAIEICRPENMHSLLADEKVDRLSNLYRELDYLHSFGDGNSRVNRVFVGELAKASGIELNWGQVNQTDMYIARDKALAETILEYRKQDLMAMQGAGGKFADELLQENLDKLNSKYPNITLKGVIKDIAKEVELSRADQFRADPATAAKKHPELTAAAAAVTAIDKKIEADNLTPEQRQTIMRRVRENAARSIEQGKAINISIKETKVEQVQQAEKELER